MPVLEKRVNLNINKKEEFFQSLNFGAEKWIGKNTEKCLMPGERSYLSYIDPAFSPSLSRALIGAKELLKHAEKRITEFGAYENEVQQLLREESQLTNDKTLQHIYKIISKKLEDLNNKSTSSRATSTVSKKSSSSTRSRSPKLSQPKPEPKIYHIQKDKVQSSCCSFFKHQQQVEPKKIYTARSVQTDFEKFDPEKNVKETDKIRKWDIQNAPVLDIPPTLKLQKLNSVNISPSCSKTFEPQNSATYNFKYNCPDPVKDSNKSEIIITQKDQVPERDTNVIENRVTEKPPKVPNKSPKLLNYQKNNIKIQRAKKKLNFNDSSSRSLSLENIQLSAVDKILQRNSERLDTVSRKTLKICKALHRHVLSNNFKNYDQTSSTDHVASSVSLDLVSSNFGTPSESNHQKEKGQKTKMSDNQEEFSIDSSDFELLKNLSSDQDSRDEGIFQREEKEDLSVEKNDKTQNVSKLVHVESMEINNSGTGSAKESDSDEICKADQVKIDDFKQHVGQVKSSDKNRELGSEDEPKKLEEEIQSTEDDLKDKRLLVTESEDGNNCEKDVTEDDDDKVREKFSQTETEGKMLDGGLVECRKNLSDELNNEQRYRKYVRKCVDMNKSLAEQISFRINEEMQMIIEKTQRELSFLKSSSAESDENRSIEKEPKMDKKNAIESEISEGEILSSNGCTFSQGEVKCTNSASSKELDVNHLNKINPFIEMTNSSSSVSFSLGEIWEKSQLVI